MAVDLVRRCVHLDPSQRPTVQQVLMHPFFWDAHKRLVFLMDVSDLLEALEGDAAETTRFERMHQRVLPGTMQWNAVVSPMLLENLGRYRLGSQLSFPSHCFAFSYFFFFVSFPFSALSRPGATQTL